MPPTKFAISKDSPAYYLTSVTKGRYRSSEQNRLHALSAMLSTRLGGLLSSFCLHTSSCPTTFIWLPIIPAPPSDIHRFVNGIISRRLIDFLKENRFDESLAKLRIAERGDGWKYSVWQHHPDTRLLWSEQMLRQRIQYTHLNPFRASLADHPNDWKWSSARIFHGKRLEDEPLEVDLESILWRR